MAGRVIYATSRLPFEVVGVSGGGAQGGHIKSDTLEREKNRFFF